MTTSPYTLTGTEIPPRPRTLPIQRRERRRRPTWQRSFRSC